MRSIFKGKYGPLLIAEIGGNHEGDFTYAKQLTQLAIDSKADFVKFQLYTGDSLVSSVESPDRNKHFKKFELDNKEHIELARMVKSAGIGYMASVWDINAVDWIDEYISVYKIGSGDLTAYPVLKDTAKIGKPIIISTGLANEDEVLDAVKFIQSCDPKYKSPENLAVLQCTSMYPIPAIEANLDVMGRLKKMTGLTVGYSDHTVGYTAMTYAYALGAEILEFHFTDTRENKKFRDHKVSLTKNEVHELIEELKLIDDLKGNEIKRPTQSEKNEDHITSFRRAVYLKRDMQEGEIISESDLCVKRPNNGIDAREFYRVVGKKIRNEIKKDAAFSFDDLIN